MTGKSWKKDKCTACSRPLKEFTSWFTCCACGSWFCPDCVAPQCPECGGDTQQVVAA